MSRLGRVYGDKAPISARLSQRVRIEQAVVIKDNLGGEQRVWQDVAVIWAELLPQAKSEAMLFGRIESQTGYKITIRYRNDISEDMRVIIVKNGEILAIDSIVNPVQGDEILQIFAKKGDES